MLGIGHAHAWYSTRDTVGIRTYSRKTFDEKHEAGEQALKDCIEVATRIAAAEAARPASELAAAAASRQASAASESAAEVPEYTWMRPVAEWSRDALRALEDQGGSMAFRIVRAAVLTQPILSSYFESPLPLTFL